MRQSHGLVIRLQSDTAIFISSLFSVFFALLVYLAEVEPPAQLQTVAGRVSSLTFVNSSRSSTGFRFCIGEPCHTFAYEGPAPDIHRVRSALDRSRRASVLYASNRWGEPMLWGLDVEGSVLVTTEELRAARRWQMLIFLTGLIISGAVAVYGIVPVLRRRVSGKGSGSLSKAE